MTFKQWMQKVDDIISARFGISYRDLPDIAYYDMWEDGRTPAAAARRALKEAGWTE